MTIHFQCRQDASLPKLGWIAVVDNAENNLNVLHGEYVEHGDGWLVEGVWDGLFQEGAFHCSDCFYGSGIKIENGKIIFVPSIGQMDRIMLCRFNGNIAASNSLLLLLAYTEASLDDNHDYRDEALSIALKGPSKYNRKFKVIHPRIKHFYQIFQENVTIENGEAGFEPKPREALSFNSYNDYYRSLVEKLDKIKRNYSSRHRKRPFTPFTTLSTGYDSTAVSCLVKDFGIEACFIGSPLDGLVFKRPEEQSERIGQKLGFNIHKLDS